MDLSHQKGKSKLYFTINWSNSIDNQAIHQLDANLVFKIIQADDKILAWLRNEWEFTDILHLLKIVIVIKMVLSFYCIQ